MSSKMPIDPARAAESNLGWILGVTAAFHGLALIFVGFRVYIRLAIVRSFGKDDAMIVMSAVSEQPLLPKSSSLAPFCWGRHCKW